MRYSRSSRRGVALVVVLAFVVLLTGVIVAFFARSMTGRQLSNSSANQIKAAALAQSASDIIIAGFKKEIASGSVPNPTPAPTPAMSNYYIPLSATNAVPVRYPSPTPGADAIPNLVRTSRKDDGPNGANPIPAPAVPSYASSVNSSTDPALGGRVVTPARWNGHYLIPRFDADATPASGIPVPPSQPDSSVSFAAPDWVLVNRNGPAVATNSASAFSGTGAINNASVTNSNFVIGRYAYAVYDEGGLLDVNAAGFPLVAPTPAPAQTGFTSTQIGQKKSLALADLTYLPIVKAPVSPDPVADPNEYLSAANVNSIVGWRNYAAGGPTGNYPNFTFNASSASNWFTNFVVNNTSSFMRVYRGASSNASSTATDQAILSRQALLRLRSSVGFSPNALQYLSTFTRSLEQPSFIPAHLLYPSTAPSINAVGGAAPPPASTADNYQGNNDAAGSVGTSSGQDLANPSFLTVRATSAFPRRDGTTAVIGEPLVKTRFSLRRLAWITYKGPSVSNMSDPNVMQAITAMGGKPLDSSDPIYQFVAQGTPANILSCFGLTWSNGMWTYAHGSPANGPIIMSLSQVAALYGSAAREPDFAELLKASINVGSLAKGGPNQNYFSGQVLNYQYTLDTSVDYNLLQIFANLVDQFDTDSYPTVIVVPANPTGVTYPRYVRGVEDLPYFYRYHPYTVVTDQPTPLLSKSDTVTFTQGATTTSMLRCQPASPTASTFKPGSCVLLLAPEVWNPHDMNALSGTTGTRPPRFRVTALTSDPAGITLPWRSGVQLSVAGSTSTIPPPAAAPTPVYTTLTETSSAFTFSDNNGQTCREPTMLWRGATSTFPGGAPTNSDLQPSQAGSLAGPYTEATTGYVYYGILVGQSPVAFTANIPTTTATASPTDSSNNYVFEYFGQANEIHNTPAGSYRQHTFRLEYQDPTTGNWIVYDEKYPDLHGLYWPNIVVNPADYTNSSGVPTNQWQSPWRSAQMNDTAAAIDPRITRFGIGIESSLTDNNTNPLLEPSAKADYTINSAAGYAAMGATQYTVLNTIRPRADRGNPTNYSSPAQTSDPGHAPTMRWYSGLGFNAAANYPYPGGAYSKTWPDFFSGLLAQNNSANLIFARNNSTSAQLYYEDADGVARRAMGGYAAVLAPSITVDNTLANEVGLPEATADSLVDGGVARPLQQSQSRPYILNRPFKNVGEMSYASRGGIWKQIDFFMPESGDTGLLDTFCIDDPPSDALVAGKVNLNTRQKPVLKSILAGSYRDEIKTYSSPPAYAFDRLSASEADLIAAKLLSITTDTTNSWHGPFTNVGDLVGRLVPNSSGAAAAADAYTYQASQNPGAITGIVPPTASYTFAGLSSALDSSVYTYNNSAANSSLQTANARVQRFRESAIRPLAAVGQTRVWNLLIDVVAQSGRYPANIGAGATNPLAQFNVEGEKRYWIHVAIDRYTGEIIDRQTEEVNE